MAKAKAKGTAATSKKRLLKLGTAINKATRDKATGVTGVLHKGSKGQGDPWIEATMTNLTGGISEKRFRGTKTEKHFRELQRQKRNESRPQDRIKRK